MSNLSFLEKAERIARWHVRLGEAWAKHPCFDGNLRNPHVRAVCRVAGTTSCTYTSLDDAWRQISRLEKTCGKLAEEADFAVEPILSDDPWHPYMALDEWYIPTRARVQYRCRQQFKKQFPKLAPLLNHARRVLAAHRTAHPATGRKEAKKLTFANWCKDHKPELVKLAAQTYLVSLTDIFELAEGKLSIEEVQELGGYHWPLLIDQPKRTAKQLQQPELF